MRTALKIVLVLIVLLVVGFIATTFIVDGVTRRGVEDRTGQALGTSAHPHGARVGLLTGNFRLRSLDVDNPPGFASSLLLHVDSVDGDIRFGTLFSDVIELPRVTLTNVEATLERAEDRANYDVVMLSIRQQEQAPEEGRRYIIHELLLQNLTVNVDIAPAALGEIGELTRLTVRIPELRLTDVGTDMDRGVVLEEVAGVLFKALVAAVIERAGDEIPALISGELKGRLAELEAIPGRLLDDVGERLGEQLRGLDPGRLLPQRGRND